MTIGDNVVVQLSDASSSHCKLMIEAPREVPVVRGNCWNTPAGCARSV